MGIKMMIRQLLFCMSKSGSKLINASVILKLSETLLCYEDLKNIGQSSSMTVIFFI